MRIVVLVLLALGIAAPAAALDAGFELEVNAPGAIAGTYLVDHPSFDPAPADATGVTADVVMAVPAEACGALTNPGAVAGKIALVDRGTCFFSLKVANAQAVHGFHPRSE